MPANDSYEIVVGLEVHAQLLTQSKLFCGDSTRFGAEPNTLVSPITLGHPGTLPRMNKQAIEFAIKMGLACNCEIERKNYFARKNYFYPDLPKGYQISQHTTPICKGGFIPIRIKDTVRSIRLNRIHLEEDAGKSLHDIDEKYSSIDYNRAGTALIEIVSEPDLRSGDEAYAFLTEIRKLVRYLKICDGNMEEGSLRCDANISVRKKGETRLGTKVEIKNLNSIRNVKRAIENEAQELIAMLERGETIIQQTKSFDAVSAASIPIRDKEDADDYRYFPDPDLPAFDLDDTFIESIRKSLPVLHEERITRYKKEFGLSDYDAAVLTEEKEFADYFENVTGHTTHYKAAANWMLGPVKSWLNETGCNIDRFSVPANQIALLIELVQTGKLSFSAASTKVFAQLLKHPFKSPEQIAAENNLLQESDINELGPAIDSVLQKMEAKVQEYKKGKKGLLGLFTGEVMKQTKGKADPKVVNQLLLEKLSKYEQTK